MEIKAVFLVLLDELVQVRVLVVELMEVRVFGMVVVRLLVQLKEI